MKAIKKRVKKETYIKSQDDDYIILESKKIKVICPVCYHSITSKFWKYCPYCATKIES